MHGGVEGDGGAGGADRGERRDTGDRAEEDGGRSVGAGSGLAGLRERLAVVDGTLEAGPVGEEVFRVVARVPLPSAESASAENSGSASTAGAAASGTSAAVGQAVVRGAAS